MFDRDVLVLELRGELLCLVEHLTKAARGLWLGAALGCRQAIENVFEFGFELRSGHTDLRQEAWNDAGFLLHQCEQKVGWRGFGVAASTRGTKSLLKRLRGFDCVLVFIVHSRSPLWKGPWDL